MSGALLTRLNALGLLALSGLLLVAFFDQFGNGSLPCPLCLLQRAAFMAAGVGLALNVLAERRAGHYGMTILSGVVGGGVAGRQILLHIVPGTGGYGEPLFGVHYYSWAFVAFVGIVVGSAVMLMLERRGPERVGGPGWLGRVAVLLFLLIALGNGVSTVVECGGGACPDDPVEYQLWPGHPVR